MADSTELYRKTYRVPTARHQQWDYGWNAAYFVTICTNERQHYFGVVKEGQMYLSEMGLLAMKYWAEIPAHFPFVELDAYVIMPNHMHGILLLNKPDDDNMIVTNPETTPTHSNPPATPVPIAGQLRFRNQGKGTLSSIIGSYKSIVTRQARAIHADFCMQSRFHDHIIRDRAAHQHIADYIINNPQNWETDKFHTLSKVHAI